MSGVGLAIALMPAPSSAQETVRITVPAGASFSVTNVASTTTGSTSTVTFSAGTWPPPNGKKFVISVKADAASFTPPSGSSIPASSVTWTASASAGTPSNGTLSFSAYGELFRSTANSPSGSVNVSWRLAALNGISGLRSGTHTLTVRWKLELL
jgi:hypothetical protein